MHVFHDRCISKDGDLSSAPLLRRGSTRLELHLASAGSPARSESWLLCVAVGVVRLIAGHQKTAEGEWVGAVVRTRTASTREEHKLVSSMWFPTVFFLLCANGSHNARDGRSEGIPYLLAVQRRKRIVVIEEK